MEFNCPQCSQRLRVANGLRNPLLRCKNCSSKFRLQEALAGGRDGIDEGADRFRSPLSSIQPRPVEAPWPPVAQTPVASSPQPWVETATPIEVVEEDFDSPSERRSPTMAEKTSSFAGSSIG